MKAAAYEDQRRLVDALLVHPELLERLPELSIDHFVDFRPKLLFTAYRNLEARGTAITIDTVIAELEAKGYADALSNGSAGGTRAHLEQRIASVPNDPSRIVAIVDELAEKVMEHAGAVEAEIDEFALRDVETETARGSKKFEPSASQPDEPKPAPRWRRCRDVVDEILSRASEPLVRLALADDEIVSVRLGGIVLLIGGTGRGKTSLAATLLIEHAQSAGPAIAFSLELPDDEWTARPIGARCDTSWLGVLRGEVPRDRMLQVLPERLAIVGRDESLAMLGIAIDDLAAEYPGEPILVAVDYAQLIGADSEDEIRPRIGKVMRQLDRLARDRRVALIVLSQGSRASARALSNGELIGAATTDAGAESADLERWASVTLAIGQHGTPAEDGSCAADISIGKSRMGNGDRVLPARYYRRSGLWRLTGEARPATEVLAERQMNRDSAKQAAAELAMAAFAERSPKPVSIRDLRTAAHVRGVMADAAIAALKARGELVDVHVRRRGMKRGEWPLWTAAKAGTYRANGDADD